MRRKLSAALVATGITTVLTAGAVSATVLMDGEPAPPAALSGASQDASTQDVAMPLAVTPPAELQTPPAEVESPPVAAPPVAAPPVAAPPVAPKKAAPKKAAATPITYVVKPGDNLSVIAAWFALRGYGELFEANRGVIGDDPDLILPGQRITITGTTVSMR